jgi:hypothetical protein
MMTLCLMVALAQDKPAAKKYPCFSIEAKPVDHEIRVTINGEAYPLTGASVQATPLKTGANVVTVAFTARAGRDRAKSKGSSLKLGVSPSLTPGADEVVFLCDVVSKEGATECVVRFEMKDLVPGTCRTVERHWFDPERKKPSEEYESEWEPLTGTIASSVHREWSDNGRKKHEVRVRAEKIAAAEYYTPDGSLGAEIKDGAGWARQWHDNGRVCQESPYRNGVVEGEEKDYFESGKVQNVTNYAAGKLQGTFRRFDESGTMRVEGAHASGEKDGIWIRHDETGKEVARSVFEKGKRVKGDDPFED